MPKKPSHSDIGVQQLAELREQLTAAQEKEKRALADYQNLIRRNQEERSRLIQLSNRELLTALLQPLEHLELAAAQTKDRGVMMVLEQFKHTLAEFGLEEIAVIGKPFDVNTMEAVETQGKGDVVTSVVRRGYSLNGAVIQHAKVVLGEKN